MKPMATSSIVEAAATLSGATFLSLEDVDTMIRKSARDGSDPVVIHFKGFGPKMDLVARPPKAEMIAALSEATVVSFDGDDHDPENSFIGAFPFLIAHCKAVGKPVPALLGWKLRSELPRFVASWQPFVAANPDIAFYHVAVNDEECAGDRWWDPSSAVPEAAAAAGGGSAGAGAAPEATTVPVPDSGFMHPHQLVYVGLAVKALSVTRRSCVPRVVAWGGLHIVRREFVCCVANWGTRIQWHYWHAKREGPVRDGSGAVVPGRLQEEEGVLVHVSHPALTIHCTEV